MKFLNLISFCVFACIDYLNDVYGNLAMVNYPYETQFLAALPAYPVREFCRHLSKPYDGDKLIDVMSDFNC